MRTRSEWFLGDGGCDEDGEHDDTCECRANAADAIRRSSTLEPHDEMDCGGHQLPYKRPVTQLFETTSGFGIPESERERNGALQQRDGEQHFTSNMFGTLPTPINAFACCDVANRGRSMHSYYHQARIVEEAEEEEEEDHSGSNEGRLHNGGDRFSLVADTHNAPVPSPYLVRKEIRRGDGVGHLDGNNNRINGNVVGVTERKRIQSNDDAFDEIMVFSPPHPGRIGEGNNKNRNNMQLRVSPRREPRPLPYLAKSHEDLGRQRQRNSRVNRSSRSSGSLNRRSQKSNDDKLMVLFKILDFIF